MKINTNKMKNYLNEHGENLDAFSSTISRVHGPEHPEILDVTTHYFMLRGALNSSEVLTEEDLNRFKELSGDFTAPEGTCEGTIDTYKKYSELYHEALTE